MSPLFADFTDRVADELDDRANRMLGVLDAVIEHARPDSDGVAQLQFRAVKLHVLSMLIASEVDSVAMSGAEASALLQTVIADMRHYAGITAPASPAGSGSRPDATPLPDPAMPALQPAGAASHKPETACD